MRRNRLFLALSLLVAASMILVACGGAATPTEAPEPTEEPMEEPTEEPMEEPTEAPQLGSEEVPIVMSFVPSGETEEIAASGEEIRALLEEETGYTIESNVATSYAAVVEAMCAGNAHIGWLAPFSYVLASQRDCADVGLATIRFGSDHYGTQIIANADAGIESLEDLAGKNMCWTDPLSTSGYVIPQGFIAEAGVDPETGFASTEFIGGHTDVVRAVYEGEQCDAGATFVDARGSVEEDLPDVNDVVLQVFVSDPIIPNDTVSYSPDVPEDVRANLTEALLAIAETEAGQEALFNVYEIEGLQEVDDSFFDELRVKVDASGIDLEELAQPE